MEMKKKFGAWLMDIAKYVTTGVIVSSLFAQIQTWIVYPVAILFVVVLLGFGLYFVRDENNNERS
jgi:hypothetical protein